LRNPGQEFPDRQDLDFPVAQDMSPRVNAKRTGNHFPRGAAVQVGGILSIPADGALQLESNRRISARTDEVVLDSRRSAPAANFSAGIQIGHSRTNFVQRESLQEHSLFQIPHRELAERFGADIDAAVVSLVLNHAGPLHLEPDRLLVEEMPSATALRPLLDAVGGGAQRLSKIAVRLGTPATTLSRPLTHLQEPGLLQRDKPSGEPEPGGRRSRSRIGGPFTRVWFRVAAPHRAALAAGVTATRSALWGRCRAVRSPADGL
jgi:hypothetical protein